MTATSTGILRQLRETAGLSLSEVSRQTGINKGRLSIIERGVDPKPDELAAILRAIWPDKPAPVVLSDNMADRHDATAVDPDAAS